MTSKAPGPPLSRGSRRGSGATGRRTGAAAAAAAAAASALGAAARRRRRLRRTPFSAVRGQSRAAAGDAWPFDGGGTTATASAQENRHGTHGSTTAQPAAANRRRRDRTGRNTPHKSSPSLSFCSSSLTGPFHSPARSVPPASEILEEHARTPGDATARGLRRLESGARSGSSERSGHVERRETRSRRRARRTEKRTVRPLAGFGGNKFQ
nr:uncharacterized protein LOC129381632 [Dermacentor andersoni]